MSLKVNPKTGKPVNINHNWYGRKMTDRTKVRIGAAIANQDNSVFDHTRKKCYLTHMQSEAKVQFECVADVCRFLEFEALSSTRQNMVTRGYHKEWYFNFGIIDEHVEIAQAIA